MNMHQHRTTLATVNSALKAIGFDPIPGADLASIPDISTPDPSEVTAALLAAKGNPSQDKQVQALVTRAYLASTGATQALTEAAWGEAGQSMRAAIPGIIEQIRAEYEQVGTVLTEAARGPLSAHHDLAALDLSGMRASLIEHAGTVVNAYRRATALHQTWRALSYARDGVNTRSGWAELGVGSDEQIFKAIATRPQSFPEANVWAMARQQWALSLPETIQAALVRRRTAIEGVNSTISTANGMAIKGNHRDAERLLS